MTRIVLVNKEVLTGRVSVNKRFQIVISISILFLGALEANKFFENQSPYNVWVNIMCCKQVTKECKFIMNAILNRAHSLCNYMQVKVHQTLGVRFIRVELQKICLK